MRKMNLSKYDPTRLKGTLFRMIMIGCSGVGKTTYFQELFNVIADEYEVVCTICPDGNHLQYVHMAKHYPGIAFAPPARSLETEDLKFAVNRIIAQRKANVHDRKDGKLIFKKKMLLIFDDVTNPGFVRTSEMARVFTSSRHLGMSVVFLIQAPFNLISPPMRNNTSHIVLFYCGNDKTIDDYYMRQISCDSRLSAMKANEKNDSVRRIMKGYISFSDHTGVVCDKTVQKVYMI